MTVLDWYKQATLQGKQRTTNSLASIYEEASSLFHQVSGTLLTVPQPSIYTSYTQNATSSLTHFLGLLGGASNVVRIATLSTGLPAGFLPFPLPPSGNLGLLGEGSEMPCVATLMFGPLNLCCCFCCCPGCGAGPGPGKGHP